MCVGLRIPHGSERTINTYRRIVTIQASLKIPDSPDEVEPLLRACASARGLELGEIDLDERRATFELIVSTSNHDPDEVIATEFAAYLRDAFEARGGSARSIMTCPVDAKIQRDLRLTMQAAEVATNVALAGQPDRLFRCRILGPKSEAETSEAAARLGGRVSEWRAVGGRPLVHLTIDGVCELRDDQVVDLFIEALRVTVPEGTQPRELGPNVLLMSEQEDLARRDDSIDFMTWQRGWNDSRAALQAPARTRVVDDQPLPG